MARLKFLADYDYHPAGKGNVVIAYKAGKTYGGVRRECVGIAVLLGKAVELEPEPRPAEPRQQPRRRRKSA